MVKSVQRATEFKVMMSEKHLDGMRARVLVRVYVHACVWRGGEGQRVWLL